MVHADSSSRGRMALLMGVIFILLGGFSLAGLIQRVWVPPTAEAEEAPSQAEIAALRLEANRVREFRDTLAALGTQGKWSAIVSAADGFLAEKDNARIRYLRAEALLHTGREHEGWQEFARLLDGELSMGEQLLLEADSGGYRSRSEEALGRIDPAKATPLAANNVAWLCALAPKAVPDYDKAVHLAEIAVQKAPEEERLAYLNTLGAILHRAGHHKEAIAALQECDKLRPDAFNWVFLALAHHRLGQDKEARRWLEKVRHRVETTYGKAEQQEYRHELLLFWREVEETLAAPPTQP